MKSKQTINGLYKVQIKSIWEYLRHAPSAFWMICFYLFVEYFRPQSIYTAIDIIPYGQLAIILSIMFYVFDRERIWVINIENKLIVFFALVIIISGLLAFSPAKSADEWVHFTQWFLVYFLIINIVNTEEKYFIFYLSFLLYSFKMSQHGFISWANKGFGWDSWGVVGGPGWFHNSGEFGIQLCMFLPLSIYFIMALYKYWGKIKLAFFMLFPFTAMTSIIATSSRGALVGAMATLLWMVIKSENRIKGLIVVSLIGLAAFSFIPEESKQRFEASGEDKTSVTRLIRWQDGIEILNDNPWFGIGYRNWGVYYANHYDRDNYGLPHNIFIDVSAELGYTGLIIFILMIIFTFINNYRTRKLAKDNNNDFIFYTAHGLDAALIGLLVSGSFVSVLYYPFFWINMAMTVSLNYIAKNNKTIKRNEEMSEIEEFQKKHARSS